MAVEVMIVSAALILLPAFIVTNAFQFDTNTAGVQEEKPCSWGQSAPKTLPSLSATSPFNVHHLRYSVTCSFQLITGQTKFQYLDRDTPDGLHASRKPLMPRLHLPDTLKIVGIHLKWNIV